MKAGVALNTLFGNNSILDNSKYATEEYNKSTEKEALALAFSNLKMKLYTDDTVTEITAELLEQQLNEAGNNVEVEEGENGTFVVTFKNTGDQYEVTANGGIVGEDKTEVPEEVVETIIEDEIILDEGYTGEQKSITLETGRYKLEVWGAQGGGNGGCGSYSSGMIDIENSETFYYNVGGKGEDMINGQIVAGGYNGGGSARSASGGGGATHIATQSGLLSALVDYKGTYSDEKKTYESTDIIIVAGGGGGTGYTGRGGDAGGYTGLRGASGSSDKGGYGGSQSVGGNVYDTGWAQKGSFGQGGGAMSGKEHAGAGGGGFFGGGTGTNGNDYAGGGGGSGYIGNSRLYNKHMTGYRVTNSTDEEIYTIGVENKSEDSMVDYAKQGDGHIRITKLGNSLNENMIPVYTSYQMSKIGSGEKVYVLGRGMFYNFDKEKTYVMQNDIRFYGDFSEIQNLINTHQVTLDKNGHNIIQGAVYETDKLLLHLNGEDNTKIGHNSETSTWYDISKVSNQNATKTAGNTNWTENALLLDGNTYYTVNSPVSNSFGTVEVSLSVDSDFTPINSNNWYQCSTIFGCELAYTQRDWAIIIDKNGKFAIGYDDHTICSSNVNALDGQRHTVSYSYMPSQLVFSVDGRIIQTINFSPSGSVCTQFGIGWNKSSANTKIKGKIYDVRFYEDALTEEEIFMNYMSDDVNVNSIRMSN